MSGYAYLLEEQKGQFRTDEQTIPTDQYVKAYKQFDPTTPPVVQPLNPTPTLQQKKILWPQTKQMQVGEDQPRETAVHSAYPSAI